MSVEHHFLHLLEDASESALHRSLAHARVLGDVVNQLVVANLRVRDGLSERCKLKRHTLLKSRVCKVEFANISKNLVRY